MESPSLEHFKKSLDKNLSGVVEFTAAFAFGEEDGLADLFKPLSAVCSMIF